MAELLAYTDGACSGNPGPGGWGAVLLAHEDGRELRRRELSGAEPLTTNNRMELMAAISALEALTRPSAITIVTDSAYVKNGVTGWIHAWKARGWRTADMKPVKNVELWQRLEAAQAPRRVEWQWIKGHAGHEGNERADELARAAVAVLRGKGGAAGAGAGKAAGSARRSGAGKARAAGTGAAGGPDTRG